MNDVRPSGLWKRNEKTFRTFDPPPKLEHRKELEWTKFDEQNESPLFAKLPAELRNAIFELVFSTNLGLYEEDPEEVMVNAEEDIEGDNNEDNTDATTAVPSSDDKENKKMRLDKTPENERPPAHPLSLLLTCRRIYQEASTLAFANHTFTTSSKMYTTFYNLRVASSVLRTSHFLAISSLAFELGPDYIEQNRRASDFFSNSMLLFEGLKRLELRVKRKRISSESCHGYDATGSPVITYPSRFSEPLREAAVRTYVPKWFHTALGDVLDGRAYAWQTGYKWKLEYPQWEYPEFLVHDDYSEARGWHVQGTMDPEHVGKVDGVRFCACGCGKPSWILARLTQDTGRKVEVEVLFYGDSDREREREWRGLSVRLRPGSKWLEGLEMVADGSGFQWNTADEFWERLRNNNRW